MSSANDDIIQPRLKRFDAMKAHRSSFENHWDEVAQVATPKDYNFQTYFSPGVKRRTQQFDSTAELSLRRATSFYDSVTTPRNKRWHGLEAWAPELAKMDHIRQYYDQVENVMFSMRYAPKAGYAGQRQSQIHSLWAFGTAPMFVDMPSRIMRYKSVHLSQFYMQENAHGIVDVGYNCLKMTVRQMMEMFGDSVPENLVKGENSEPDRLYEVLHTCEPNKNPDPESLRPEDRAFVSYYILNDEKKVLLDTTGYKNFPYSVSRDSQSTNEVYGRSVLMSVLQTVKLLNQMKKTDIKAKHNSATPPALMSDDGAVDPADLIPDRAVVGGLDRNGNPRVVPYLTGANHIVADNAIAAEQATVREAFLLDLFINQLEREATATEVLTRTQEQARILAPMTGREESESIGPMVEREYQLLEDAGLLPPMPPEIIEAQEQFRVRFTSPIANAQKADEAIGATQTLQAALNAAQFDPKIMHKLKLDEYLEIQAEANSTPWRMIASEEEYNAIIEGIAQQEQEQSLMENAQGLSQAGLNVANMEKVVNE